MQNHISNKIISSRNVLILCVLGVLIGFMLVILLINYFPRDNKIYLNNIETGQSIKPTIKNQITILDESIYNLTKAISKDKVTINFLDKTKDLNDRFSSNENIFYEIINSKAIITSGKDKWMEYQQDKIPKSNLKILDLSKKISLKPNKVSINLNSGTSPINENTINLDYNYLLDFENLETSIISVNDFLVEFDPSNKDFYDKNTTELNTNILEIKNQYTELSQCQNKKILTNANNLNYFADQYNFDITILDNFDPQSPTENQIKYVKSLANSQGFKSIFIDKKIPLLDFNSLKSRLELEIYNVSYLQYLDVPDTLSKNLLNLKKAQDC